MTAPRPLINADGSLRMACTPPPVSKVFSITRLTEVVTVFDTVAAAGK